MALPRRAVWLSVDDGWKENVTEIVPAIKEYGIPITLFITTGPVESGKPFWFSTARAFNKKLPILYQGDALWKVAEAERKKVIEDLEQELKPQLLPEAMSVAEVKSLAALPSVTIGNHTFHHIIMPNCTPQEIQEELALSQQRLEEWTGRKPLFFAYPHGAVDEKSVEAVREAGFQLAVTTKKDFITFSSDCFQLPRFCVNDDAYFPETLCQMVGVWGWLMERMKLARK